VSCHVVKLIVTLIELDKIFKSDSTRLVSLASRQKEGRGSRSGPSASNPPRSERRS